MKCKNLVFIILSVLLQAFPQNGFAKTKYSAQEIVRHLDSLLSPSHALSKLELTVYRDGKQVKSYKMILKSGGEREHLLEFQFPPRNQGEKILRLKGNIWMYFSNINKIIRLSAKAQFASSDFSNTDILARELKLEYDAKIIGEKPFNGKDAILLQLDAKADTSTYAKIICYVDSRDLSPLRQDYFTLSGSRLKSLIFSSSARNRTGNPDILTMKNVLQTNRTSVLRIIANRSGIKYPKGYFSRHSLKTQ